MNWFASSIANYWRIALVSAETLTTLTNIFSSAVKQRSENIPAQKARDFIDLMLQLKKDNQNDVALTEPRLLAQAIQIFAAGFETVNSSLAYTIHELAINPSIQERLREEIKETIAKYNGEITYEAIQEMKYLDMCFSETLRKYPVLPFLDRRCTKDYVLPGTNVFIKEGIPVLVPMMGIHSDPKFYPDPDTYDPERFKDKSVYNTDGFNYFPFGEGPRSCIGERFGLLTIKLGFVKILSQFEVKTNQETQHPLNFEAKSFLLLTRKGVPLTFVPLKDKQL
ncbi:cytochrome P450 6l1-like [Cylas formicarius]|uniref:cytochrome P450 6l1-like n=1 Tax=Cylas formicarius TaxID=197179 RepID=UPI002958CD3F|nr:cytochrome P450 6l1-like [Cylas formicarius]